MSAYHNELLFSGIISQNKAFFEIKNSYQEALEAQEKRIKSQQLILLTNRNKMLRLRYFTLMLVILSLLVMVFTISRRKARNLVYQEKLKNQKQELELANHKEILDLKNKELLGSAMQLMERDSLQAEISKKLNTLVVEKKSAGQIKQINSLLKVNVSQKWTEFEMRFTKLNESFFTALKAHYPSLTPIDLKMCAFIRLGFTTKDMAQIMGITAEGINTSRSRLRKKIGLRREVNLVSFLSDF